MSPFSPLSPHVPPAGLLFVVELSSILSRFPNSSLLWPHSPGRPTAEPADPDSTDGYRGERRGAAAGGGGRGWEPGAAVLTAPTSAGYTVAVGELDGDPKTKGWPPLCPPAPPWGCDPPALRGPRTPRELRAG